MTSITARRLEKQERAIIRAELIGSDTCTACGITAMSAAPVLALCRDLIAAGIDPAARLEAYRGQTLCLVVHSIGQAAGVEINSKGTGLIPRRAVRAASPIRDFESAATEADGHRSATP
jgi:hypothetical protein